jgi:hypothetical protein
MRAEELEQEFKGIAREALREGIGLRAMIELLEHIADQESED